MQNLRVKVRTKPPVLRVRVVDFVAPKPPEPGEEVEVGGLSFATVVSLSSILVTRSVAGVSETQSSSSASVEVAREASGQSSAHTDSTAAIQVERQVGGLSDARSLSSASIVVGGGIGGQSDARTESQAAVEVSRRVGGQSDVVTLSSAAAEVTRNASGTSDVSTQSLAAAAVSREAGGLSAASTESRASAAVARQVAGQSDASTASSTKPEITRQVGGLSDVLALSSASILVTRSVGGQSDARTESGASISVGGGEDADATSYLNAQTTAPSTAERSRVDTLVKGLKSNNLWAKLDRLSLLAAESAQASRLCLRNPSKSMLATNLTSASFTANRGWTGDTAAGGFLDFQEPYLNGASMFQQDSASVFVWCNNAVSPVVTTGTGRVPQVGNTGAARVSIQVLGAAGNNVWQVNVSVATAYAGSGMRSGFRCAVRPSAANQQVYTNGQLVSDISSGSTTPSTTNGCSHRSATVYGDDRLAAIGYGAALTASDVANLNTLLGNYLNSKSAA